MSTKKLKTKVYYYTFSSNVKLDKETKILLMQKIKDMFNIKKIKIIKKNNRRVSNKIILEIHSNQSTHQNIKKYFKENKILNINNIELNVKKSKLNKSQKSLANVKHLSKKLKRCSQMSKIVKKKNEQYDKLYLLLQKMIKVIHFLNKKIKEKDNDYNELNKLIDEITEEMKGQYHISDEDLNKLKHLQTKMNKNTKNIEAEFENVFNDIMSHMSIKNSF